MLRALKTFLAIIDYGSFAAAGNQLGLTQSAVSAQIKGLENQLGYTLFDRSKQRASLTVQAEQALPYIKEIVEKMTLLSYLPDENLPAKLRLGVIASVQSYLLPKLMSDLFAILPSSHVSVMASESLGLLNLLETAQIDAAIMLKPDFILPKHLYQVPIITEHYCLIAPKTAGFLPMAALFEHYPLIAYPPLSVGGRQVEAYLKKQGIVGRERLVIDDLMAIMLSVKAGVGVAIVPDVAPWIDDIERVVLQPPLTRTLCLVVPYHKRRQVITQKLIELLSDTSPPSPSPHLN